MEPVIAMNVVRNSSVRQIYAPAYKKPTRMHHNPSPSFRKKDRTTIAKHSIGYVLEIAPKRIARIKRRYKCPTRDVSSARVFCTAPPECGRGDNVTNGSGRTGILA